MSLLKIFKRKKIKIIPECYIEDDFTKYKEISEDSEYFLDNQRSQIAIVENDDIAYIQQSIHNVINFKGIVFLVYYSYQTGKSYFYKINDEEG